MCSNQPSNWKINCGDFFLPFRGKLDEENRKVQLVQLEPWAAVAKKYIPRSANVQFADGTLRAHHSRENASFRPRDLSNDQQKSHTCYNKSEWPGTS